MQVDGGIRLGGWLFERGSSTEDMIWGKEPILVDFLNGCHHTPQRAAAYDGQAVFLACVHLLKLGGAVDAWFSVTFELLNNLIFLHADVLLHFVGWDGKVELFLQGDDHTAKILADEVIEQFGPGVTLLEAILGENLVGEISASFEGKLLTQDESVVTIKEQFGNLERVVNKKLLHMDGDLTLVIMAKVNQFDAVLQTSELWGVYQRVEHNGELAQRVEVGIVTSITV